MYRPSFGPSDLAVCQIVTSSWRWPDRDGLRKPNGSNTGLLITAGLRAKSERGLIWFVMWRAGVKLVGQSSLAPTTLPHATNKPA